MNEIAQMVPQKFNLSPEVSQQPVDFIVTQVKGKLPEGLSQHVDGLLAGGTEAEGIMGKLKELPAASWQGVVAVGVGASVTILHNVGVPALVLSR
ncbi:MAG TPA: hypothetical protein VF772_01640 [Terriglobales bacterium]